jgi:hypothetical protein
MPFTPQMRVLLIVLVLVCAAAGVGLMVMGRAQSSSEDAPVSTTPVTSTPQSDGPAAATPPVQRKAPEPAPAPRDRLPAAVRQALSANRVVVIALFDPKAKIDDIALREASAGAQLAGSAFVQVDVTTNEVDSLNLRYGVIQDPAVLVLRPPADLVVRLDGFADRDTVAQAAANAVS